MVLFDPMVQLHLDFQRFQNLLRVLQVLQVPVNQRFLQFQVVLQGQTVLTVQGFQHFLGRLDHR